MSIPMLDIIGWWKWIASPWYQLLMIDVEERTTAHERSHCTFSHFSFEQGEKEEEEEELSLSLRKENMREVISKVTRLSVVNWLGNQTTNVANSYFFLCAIDETLFHFSSAQSLVYLHVALFIYPFHSFIVKLSKFQPDALEDFIAIFFSFSSRWPSCCCCCLSYQKIRKK